MLQVMHWLSRAVLAGAATLLLNACATTQTSDSSAKTGDSSDSLRALSASLQGSVQNSFQALSNVFDRTGTSFRSLVQEQKYSDAYAFLERNPEYFDKRAKEDSLRLAKDVLPVADYYYKTQFAGLVNNYTQQLVLLPNVSDSQKWGAQAEILRKAAQLVAMFKAERIFQLSEPFEAHRATTRLSAEVARVSRGAEAGVTEAIQSTTAAVLSSGLPPVGIKYIHRHLQSSDYLRSPYFQAALLDKVKAIDLSDIQSMLDKHKELTSKSTFERAMTEAVLPKIRTQLLADGRIDLAELKRLIVFKSTFPAADFDSLVRIGIVDLTSETIKNRGAFDFQVEFKQDLPIKMTDAKEYLLRSGSLKDFDFVLVTDLSVAKINREFRNKKDVTSRAQSGTRPVQNPNYVTAMTQYQTALNDMRSASVDAAINRNKPCYGGPIACALVGLASGLAEGASKNKVEEASQLLARTPQFNDEPVYQPYQYQSVEVHAAKTVRLDYYVIDIKGRESHASYVEINNVERFNVAYNVHEADPRKASIFANTQKESDVVEWEKRPVSLKLSQLLEQEALSSAQRSVFTSEQAFLQQFTSRTYASAAPTYTSNPSDTRVTVRSSTQSSSSSPQTIADERFDSVVVVRTPKSVGTGFYVTPDLILTAYHVVDDANLVELSMFDGTKNYGKVVDHDVRLDLALIRAQAPGKPAKIHTGPLRLGETVEAIGHPKGYEFTITRGVISAMRRTRGATNVGTSNPVEFVQTDTPISPGNSGGPLFLGTAVIGVNDWIRVDKGSQNLNFSVSYNEIKSYIDRFLGK